MNAKITQLTARESRLLSLIEKMKRDWVQRGMDYSCEPVTWDITAQGVRDLDELRAELLSE